MTILCPGILFFTQHTKIKELFPYLSRNATHFKDILYKGGGEGGVGGGGGGVQSSFTISAEFVFKLCLKMKHKLIFLVVRALRPALCLTGHLKILSGLCLVQTGELGV